MTTSYTYTAAAAPTKEVKRAKNWATGKIEWDCYYSGRYVGSADSKAAADARLDLLAFESLRRGA